jgi:hypothetical protein
MSTYRENLDITVEQWIELLQDSSIFKDDDINLIKNSIVAKNAVKRLQYLPLFLVFQVILF